MLSPSSTSGWFSFADNLPGQNMEATTYYATVTVYYRDYEVYALYDDWGDGEGYTQPGRPTITGSNLVWWFDGQSPGNYSTSIVLATDAGSSAQWSVVSGQDRVFLSSSVGDSVTLISSGTAFSQSENDIKIVVTGWWGQTSEEHSITTRRPYLLEPVSSPYECDPTYGYYARVIYVIKDQLGSDLPSNVPLNEEWTSEVQNDYGGSNWRRAGPKGFTTVDAAAFQDDIFGEAPSLPAVPQPTCDGNSQPVQHWGQSWRIGTESIGVGVGVQTYTLQKLVGRAIHTNVISPPQ